MKCKKCVREAFGKWEAVKRIRLYAYFLRAILSLCLHVLTLYLRPRLATGGRNLTRQQQLASACVIGWVHSLLVGLEEALSREWSSGLVAIEGVVPTAFAIVLAAGTKRKESELIELPRDALPDLSFVMTTNHEFEEVR